MKRTIGIILAIGMIACLFAGCGSTANTTGESSKKVLTMATNAAFPPYEFYEDNKIVGIDAEIAAAIADKLGMELKIEDMEFDSIISAITSGKADIALAGMTVTEERKQNVNFSNSYATGIQSIIVKTNSPIQTFDDITKGMKVGVQTSTTGDLYVTDDLGDDAMERYSKGTEAVLALKQGKVDAVVIDNEPAKAFVKENTDLKILDTEYAIEDYAIAMAKDNTELQEKVNKALDELTKDGTIKGILDKYISAK